MGRGVHREGQFGLLAVVHRQAFEEEGAEARSRAPSSGEEDGESLQGLAPICDTSDPVHCKIDHFFAHGVVSPGKAAASTRTKANGGQSLSMHVWVSVVGYSLGVLLVGGVFFPRDQLFGVVESFVFTASDFIDHRRFEVQIECSWDVLARGGFGEERAECFFGGAIGGESFLVDSVFEAEELPARISDLDAGLSNV